jgi:hypothetical protein
MGRILSIALLCIIAYGAVWGQTGPFNPGANPVSNQGYDWAVIVVGTSFKQVSRAIYNGNASACNFTATSNAGNSANFQNNNPGQYNPIQATVITASTCSAGALLVIY